LLKKIVEFLMEKYNLIILKGIFKAKAAIYYQLTLIDVGEGSKQD